jgi:hypothetical protein
VNFKVLGVDAGSYRAHDLHRTERIWLETNCYVDLWIELLHSMQLDPVPSMAFTVTMDFEGDQWTFFKQPHADLYRLYGLDVQELTIWRPVRLHLAEQVQAGRIPMIEVDSFHLPDTAGIAYQIDHTKTTIGVESIDIDARRLGYFHNAGFFELTGENFDGLFNQATPSLPPFAEIVKRDRVLRRDDVELAAIASELMRHYVSRIPTHNPVTRYRQRLVRDMSWLESEDMSVFYKYAFATLRQCGACAEMASTFLAWLAEHGGDATIAASELESIAAAAKAVQFKLARMMATRKPADVGSLLDVMETAWDKAMSDLSARYAS